MIRRFENEDLDEFWHIELIDDCIVVTTGKRGTEGEVEVFDDSFTTHGLPEDVLFDELVGELEAGFVEVLPDDLLDVVEAAHEVTLTGRLRAFYLNREYLEHQGKICNELDCRVNFIANAVLGNFYEEFYDAENEEDIELIPISSKEFGDDYDEEDEQQWIGVDPSLGDGPVYELFTSGEYSEAYPNLDAFLADLRVED